jgi:glutamyl-Q tRNA(Asp) synthetase
MSDVTPPVVTTRFAPSPTGLLHLGHAASALLAWRRARSVGGRFLLRIEDIDPARCRPEFVDALMEDLAWIGIEWDGPVRVQSACLDDYRTVLRSLDLRGLLYPCFCSRAEIQREVAESAGAPHAPDGSLRYPGTCRSLPPAERLRRLASNEPHVLRLDIGRALEEVAGPLWFHEEGQGRVVCDPAQFGDVVLARRDSPASYHLCVTHDDTVQGVTLVTRGVDLFPVTQLHRLLQALMNWPTPRYAHHRLLTDAAGRRLSKRNHALALRDLRSAGVSAAEVRRRAAID